MRLRKQRILEYLRSHQEANSEEMLSFLNQERFNISEPTLLRDLKKLLKDELIQKVGKARATKYKAMTLNTYNIAFDMNEYYKVSQDERIGPVEFNFSVFDNLKNIFTEIELGKTNKASQKYKKDIEKISEIELKKEIERLTIDLSWKSSEIEGNTYDLIDTEILIKENKEASGHSEVEKNMILNHKKAIDYIFKNKDFKELTLEKIFHLHSLLVNKLGIEIGIRNHKVRIGGTNYYPLNKPEKIEKALKKMIDVVNETKEPILKALLVVLLISYIQPFSDGNKRTARIVANAILISYDLCPLSYRSVSTSEYKKALLIFYEQNSVYNFKQLYIEQYIFAVENYFN